MAQLPASGYLSNSARTEGEMKTAFEDLRDTVSQLTGGSAETTLTISAGSITPPTRDGGSHAVDTEASASTDDLTTIDQTNVPDGRLLLIRAANSARTVVVKHAAGGTGQILLADNTDFSLDDTDKWLLLKRIGTNWEELFRSFGADKAGQRTYLGLGGWAQKYAGVLAKSADYTVATADDGKLIAADATTAVVTITLPAAATAGDGFMVAIRKTDSGSNKVTVQANGTETIDGANTHDLLAQYSTIILQSDGTGWHVLASHSAGGSGGGGLLAMVVFTASGTYTKNTSASRIKVTVVGGGGGGGGCLGGYGSGCAGGGGGGGCAIKVIDNSTVGATESVTVGAGGGGGSTNGGNGGTGGTSSFGAHCSATGGGGGQGKTTSDTTRTGGSGGSGSGGDINLSGAGGHPSMTTGVRTSGVGGASAFGGGATARLAPGSGYAGGVYGGGGSGAATTGSGYSGGSGAAGVVIVEEYA